MKATSGPTAPRTEPVEEINEFNESCTGYVQVTRGGQSKLISLLSVPIVRARVSPAGIRRTTALKLITPGFPAASRRVGLAGIFGAGCVTSRHRANLPPLPLVHGRRSCNCGSSFQ